MAEEKNFVAEKSKSNRAKCKKCKEILNQGTLRIAKVMPNPFGDGKMMAWHHPQCLVAVFSKQRATTAKITCVDDIGGWDELSMEHQNEIFTTFPDSKLCTSYSLNYLFCIDSLILSRTKCSIF